MRFCRFNHDRLGVVKGTQVHDVTEALEALPTLQWPVPPGDYFFNQYKFTITL